MTKNSLNLRELITQLGQAGRIKPSRLRCITSSANRYAELLGCSDASSCTEDTFVMSIDALYDTVDEALSAASTHTRSNTKKDIGFVLRQGWQLGLIPLPADTFDGTADKPFDETLPGTIVRRKTAGNLPRRMAKELVARHRSDRYSLPLEHWGVKLRAEYDEWVAWVTKPSPFDMHRQSNRAATIRSKTDKLEAFFGYLYNVRNITDDAALDFKMIVDVSLRESRPFTESPFTRMRLDVSVGLLEEFIMWLNGERLKRKSVQARETAAVASSVASRYLHERARSEGEVDEAQHWLSVARIINLLRRTLERKKTDESIIPTNRLSIPAKSGQVGNNPPKEGDYVLTRADLLKVAEAEFPASNAARHTRTARTAAAQAGHAVALLLMIYHPELHNKRCRQLRFVDKPRNCDGGRWHLRFSLKPLQLVAETSSDQPRPLCYYDVPVAQDAGERLEEYLSQWRPVLLRDDVTVGVSDNYVFVNARGRQFADSAFNHWMQAGVYRWLGVRASPRAIHALSVATLTELRLNRNMLIDDPQGIELVYRVLN